MLFGLLDFSGGEEKKEEKGEVRPEGKKKPCVRNSHRNFLRYTAACNNRRFEGKAMGQQLSRCPGQRIVDESGPVP